MNVILPFRFGAPDIIPIESRRCHKCGVELTRGNKCHGTNVLCKDCKNAWDREYKKRRRADPNDTYREDERIRAMKHYHTVGQKKRDEFLNQYKTPCIKCGEARLSAIVFHHIDPNTKSFCVGGGALGKHSKEEVEAEIKKCVCLCENCHREFHHKYWNKNDNIPNALKDFIQK